MSTTMITTVDNPFNPFTQFDDWYTWDLQAGYDTCGLLERFVHASTELSDNDEIWSIEQAINELVTLNPFGVHQKIVREDM